jgi:hypothetical protein
VLPGGSTEDVPTFLSPAITTVYRVSAFTVPGAESLLRGVPVICLHQTPPPDAGR